MQTCDVGLVRRNLGHFFQTPGAIFDLVELEHGHAQVVPSLDVERLEFGNAGVESEAEEVSSVSLKICTERCDHVVNALTRFLQWI